MNPQPNPQYDHTFDQYSAVERPAPQLAGLPGEEGLLREEASAFMDRNGQAIGWNRRLGFPIWRPDSRAEECQAHQTRPQSRQNRCGPSRSDSQCKKQKTGDSESVPSCPYQAPSLMNRGSAAGRPRRLCRH